MKRDKEIGFYRANVVISISFSSSYVQGMFEGIYTGGPLSSKGPVRRVAGGTEITFRRIILKTEISEMLFYVFLNAI